MTNAASLARHTSRSTSEWYTPAEYIEAAHEVMGGLDLDPASNQIAQRRVRATQWYGLDHPEEDRRDGLSPDVDWHVAPFDMPNQMRIWLNPPSPPRRWWGRLVASVGVAGIYLSYSIEAVQQSQGWRVPMTAYPICIPRLRIRYETPAHQYAELLERRNPSTESARAAQLRKIDKLRAMPADALVPGDAPAHASAIVGVRVDVNAFVRVFGQFGDVVGRMR